jgi:serine/threonine-protein kinase RsbW
MTENNLVLKEPHSIMTLRVVNDIQYIEMVLMVIGSIARRFSMPEKDIGKLCMATEEAMVNVINYAFSPKETAYFEIKIAVSGMDFMVTIHDKGKPFDFSTLELSNEKWDGLGVKMMQGLTDKVEFKNLGSEGREQSLVKRLVELPVYQKRNEEEPQSLPEQIEFDIHPLKEEEAIEVAQCIYDEFGYTYISEMIYYPQQFYEACLQGDIYSFVAVAPDGEVAGHLALTISKEFPGMAEMGIGVVKRKFRKYSIMNRLTDLIIHKAQHELKLTALFAQPVAYHTITQKMCNNYNLTACYFAFHYLTDEFTPTFEKEKSRLSVACGTLPFTDSLREIYLPEEVTPMISEIIQNMKIERRILKGEQPNPSDETVGTLSINQKMRLGKCFIEKAGADVMQNLKRSVLILKQEKCAVAELYINLSDPAAPHAYQNAKTFNFFCTGILPQSSKGDYLVMECLMNDVVDYDTVKTIEPFTSLLHHIRRLDPNEG